MKKFMPLLSICTVVFFIFLLFFQSDDKAILSHLDSFRESLRITEKESKLQIFSRSRTMVKHFSKSPELIILLDSGAIRKAQSPQDIIDLSILMRSQLKSLVIHFFDLEVEISSDGASAKTTGKMQIIAGDWDTQNVEIRFSLKKIEGDWKITGFENLDPIQIRQH